MKQQESANAWEWAAKLPLMRCSPCGLYAGDLEDGVKFFVLMLEQLGAKTEYSCEGHPGGFYVLFRAPLRLARKIQACGFFTVELENRGRWSIRLPNVKTKQDLDRVCRSAAQAWEAKLGRLNRRARAAKKEKTHAKLV